MNRIHSFTTTTNTNLTVLVEPISTIYIDDIYDPRITRPFALICLLIGSIGNSLSFIVFTQKELRRNSTFRYCDPQFVHKTAITTSNLPSQTKSQINHDKSSVHNSLSTLPLTGIKKLNNVESNTLQIRPAKDLQLKKSNQIIESGYFN